MDTSLISFELRDNYLLIVGHGKRDTLASMTQASAQIYEAIQATKSSYLLVDYRKLQINVHFSEAFNIVKRYEVALPGLKEVTIAAVFAEKGLDFGRYWKEIAVQRGFFIEIFESMELAEAWLLRKIQ